jgi:hypothetical protein
MNVPFLNPSTTQDLGSRPLLRVTGRIQREGKDITRRCTSGIAQACEGPWGHLCK